MNATDTAALSLHGVSKSYRIWETPAGRLTAPCWEKIASLLPAEGGARRWFTARAARSYRDFWALKDVTFTVAKGESIGLIGRNGSGKSTLLQLIASTLRPTSGVVNVQGRVAALLELGAGFDAEFTGRENVYVNAAILGLSRAEIDAQVDAIATFAEIGDFFDQPVKTYSSGMVVRLAFAVAAHVKPDILIVDEALSVGDARFQLKCARTIDRFIAQGVTLLFVSHDLSLVKRLCKRALLLDAGRVLYSGHPNDVANLYSKLLADDGSAATIATDIAALEKKVRENTSPAPPSPSVQVPPSHPSPLREPPSASAPQANAQQATAAFFVCGSNTHTSPSPAPAVSVSTSGSDVTPLASSPTDATRAQSTALLASEIAPAIPTGNEFAYGGERGEIKTLTALAANSEARTTFSSGETACFRMTVLAREPVTDPIYALTLKNTAGVDIYGTNTLFGRQPAPAIAAGETHQIDFTLPLNVPAGTYFLSFGFTHFVGDTLVVVHRRYEALKIEVHSAHRTLGLIDLRATITTRPL
jgi:ABC-type polysaccharide/polyol phosphate transport system ATPase subunit